MTLSRCAAGESFLILVPWSSLLCSAVLASLVVWVMEPWSSVGREGEGDKRAREARGTVQVGAP